MQIILIFIIRFDTFLFWTKCNLIFYSFMNYESISIVSVLGSNVITTCDILYI